MDNKVSVKDPQKKVKSQEFHIGTNSFINKSTPQYNFVSYNISNISNQSSRISTESVLGTQEHKDVQPLNNMKLMSGSQDSSYDQMFMSPQYTQQHRSSSNYKQQGVSQAELTQ